MICGTLNFLWDTTLPFPINISLDNFVVVDESVGNTITKVQKEIDSRNSNISLDAFFDNFRPYNEWETYLDLITTNYPNLAQKFIIGKTYQGRDIVGFTVTAGSTEDKPEIYLQGLVHAREWLAPTNVLWILMALLNGYGTDPDATLLLDNIRWTIVPLVNVDGYIYTWTNSRLWRKNRRLNSGGTYGVDLNRNWGPQSTWCTAGSSRSPNSDTYCGTAPFSESESQSVSEYIDSRRGKMKAGIDFHTVGPLLLWPWQYTYDRVPPPDYTMFQSLGSHIVNSINAVHGQRYVSQQGCDLYTHSGGFIDYNWLENRMISFTVEGRGNGFVVDPSNINPSGEECYAGVIELARYILSNQVES